MKALKSHPDLLLTDHIQQVMKATDGLLGQHSGNLVTADIKRLSGLAARSHDLGKGVAPFQEYIEAPDAYSGGQDDKSHTPMSLLLSLLLAKTEGWDAMDTLILAACARGHHGELPYLPPVNPTDTSGRTIDDFSGKRINRILKRQIETLDASLLTGASGFDFGPVDLSPTSISAAVRYLRRDVIKSFHGFVKSAEQSDAVRFRLKAQLVFSLLLEADKAFLAVPDPAAHAVRRPRPWRSAWIDEMLANAEETAVNDLRKNAREAVVKAISEKEDHGILSLTAPTGVGKTLLAGTWALTMRERLAGNTNTPPKIIIVLPFLSIIDQTVGVYRALLEKGCQKTDGAWLLTSHSLSDRRYDPTMENDQERFFIDTWRSEMIITTYDQFLMSLISPKARYQMRFHNLCDALIIMDEVQAIPCKLWQLLSALFSGLADGCNSRLLLMSATLPPFAADAAPLLENYRDYFKSFSRYRLHLRLNKPASIDEFCEEMASRIPGWLEDNERVLITLNTRASARRVYDHLKRCWPDGYDDIPTFFLSADVTPRDRLRKIKQIKNLEKGVPCIVVSTQCVEAGVDIDMDRVIRDFAPWDSIVQIAGRCNRAGNKGKWLPVEIVDLVNSKGRRFSDMIYGEADNVALEVTRQLTGSYETINEEDVLDISDRYFQLLNERRDTGATHLDRFIAWREDEPIRELLRGKDREQHTFIVADPCLLRAMEKTHGIDDRWERREAWRRLAGKIANVSISIYARKRFEPAEIAKERFGHWVLKPGMYDPDRGILLDDMTVDPASGTGVF
jgi:CRISPR-associated endonuclease/helicase Cas3